MSVEISVVGGDWPVIMYGVFKPRIIFKFKKSKNLRGDPLTND